MHTEADEGGLKVQMRLAGRDHALVIPEPTVTAVRHAARIILHEPFTRRTWFELLWFVVSSVLAGITFFVVGITLAAGAAFVVTFIGLFVIAAAVRMGRGFGGWQRWLARALLGVEVEAPDAFSPRPGAFGWLQSALGDRTGWRSIAYFLVKVPFSLAGVLTAFSVWLFAAAYLFSPLIGYHGEPPIVRLFLRPGFFTVLGPSGFGHGFWVFVTGVVFLFIAPWPMRFIVYLDRLLV